MSESTIKLSGWKVIPVILVLIVILGVRIIGSKETDENLVREINLLLMSEYLPGDAAKIKALYETGNMEKLSKAARSITTTTIDLESVKSSYPIFNFSTGKKDVVVKVVYVIKDTDGIRESGVKYYEFEHRPLGNTWRYRYEVTALSYFLNFL